MASQEKSQAQTSRLLRLPAEVRNQIYELALYEDRRPTYVDINLKEPALLSTCSQIRQEALVVWYLANTFHVILTDYNVASQIHWLTKMQRDIPKGAHHGSPKVEVCAICRDVVLWSFNFREGTDNTLVRFLKTIHDFGWKTATCAKIADMLKDVEEYKQADLDPNLLWCALRTFWRRNMSASGGLCVLLSLPG